jgi:hypothetical protein
MKRFEYKVDVLRGDILFKKELDELGLKGWELCGYSRYDLQHTYYFKRELPEETKDN